MKSNFAINGFKCVGVRCKFICMVRVAGADGWQQGAGSWVESQGPRVAQLELTLPRQRQGGAESPRAWPLRPRPPGPQRGLSRPPSPAMTPGPSLWSLLLSPPKHPRPHPLPLAEDPRIQSRALSWPSSRPNSEPPPASAHCPGPAHRCAVSAPSYVRAFAQLSPLLGELRLQMSPPGISQTTCAVPSSGTAHQQHGTL